MLKQAGFLTRPTLATTSPTLPESAKTASSPRDAPFPELYSQSHASLRRTAKYASLVPLPAALLAEILSSLWNL